MNKLFIAVAAATFAASTGFAAAQSSNQTPAVSPSQTQQKPGGADGGLEPDDTKNPRGGAMNRPAPMGTTGAGTEAPRTPGSGQAAPSGGAQQGSAPAPSVKPTEPSRSNP